MVQSVCSRSARVVIHRSRARALALGAAVLVVASAGSSAHAIVVGFRHDFQDGTIQEWGGGTNLTNEAGGPGGSTDRFLRSETSAIGGSGSHLALYHFVNDWRGDYTTAGVSAIGVAMRNLGTSPLEMRVVLFSGTTKWTSTVSTVLPVGGDWQNVQFNLNTASLTRVSGNLSLASTLGNVERLMFRHDPGTPSSSGVASAGVVGVDNITALPTPAVAALIIPAGWMLARRRRATN